MIGVEEKIENLKNLDVLNRYGELIVKHKREAYVRRDFKQYFDEIIRRMKDYTPTPSDQNKI